MLAICSRGIGAMKLAFIHDELTVGDPSQGVLHRIGEISVGIPAIDAHQTWTTNSVTPRPYHASPSTTDARVQREQIQLIKLLSHHNEVESGKGLSTSIHAAKKHALA